MDLSVQSEVILFEFKSLGKLGFMNVKHETRVTARIIVSFPLNIQFFVLELIQTNSHNSAILRN